ncbi:MAG: hypothetical protein V1881_03050 [Candidatus Micrarchaeota archaeon]
MPMLSVAGKAALEKGQLKTLRSLGYKNFEIHGRLSDFGNSESAKRLMKESELSAISYHVPDSIWLEKDAPNRELLVQAALEFARDIGVKRVIIHGPYTPTAASAEDALEELRKVMTAKKRAGYNGKVLVENTMTNSPITGAGGDIRFLREAGGITDGICLDIDHARQSFVQQWVTGLWNPLAMARWGKMSESDRRDLKGFLERYGDHLPPVVRTVASTIAQGKYVEKKELESVLLERIMFPGAHSPISLKTLSAEQIRREAGYYRVGLFSETMERVFAKAFLQSDIGKRIRHVHLTDALMGVQLGRVRKSPEYPDRRYRYGFPVVMPSKEGVSTHFFGFTESQGDFFGHREPGAGTTGMGILETLSSLSKITQSKTRGIFVVSETPVAGNEEHHKRFVRLFG